MHLGLSNRAQECSKGWSKFEPVYINKRSEVLAEKSLHSTSPSSFFLKESGHEKFMSPDPKGKPHIRCYTAPTTESRRAQRGRSRAKRNGEVAGGQKFTSGF